MLDLENAVVETQKMSSLSLFVASLELELEPVNLVRLLCQPLVHGCHVFGHHRQLALVVCACRVHVTSQGIHLYANRLYFCTYNACKKNCLAILHGRN